MTRYIMTRYIMTTAIVVMLSLPSLAWAQQVITSDTTWSAAQSPHTVGEDTTVAAGATLTIEAGATVQFDKGVSLTVAGTLTARGSSTRPVLFTGTPAGAGKARWGSLVFTRTSTGASFSAANAYSGGSILERCTLEHATRAIRIEGASPFIHRCTLKDHEYDGKTDPRGGAALMITDGAAPRVVGCTFSNNAALNAEGGAVYSDASSPVLQDNTFAGNSAFYGGALSATGLYSPVVGNTFKGNSASFEGGGASFVSSAPAFLNNLVDGNYAATDGGGVHVCVDCYPHANPLFMDNTIINNTNLVYIGAAGVGAAYVRVFAHNNVHGNKRKSGVPSDFGWFHLLSEQYPALVAAPDLSRNWWGTTDTAKIDRAIHDGNDDDKHGKLTYQPVLRRPSPGAQTRVTITTLKIRYKDAGEKMPVFLTLYNPGPAREVELVLMLGYGGRAPVHVRHGITLPAGAVTGRRGARLALGPNSVQFIKLVEPGYRPTTGLGHGVWHATLLDAKTGARIGDTSTARFELGQGPSPAGARSDGGGE